MSGRPTLPTGAGPEWMSAGRQSTCGTSRLRRGRGSPATSAGGVVHALEREVAGPGGFAHLLFDRIGELLRNAGAIASLGRASTRHLLALHRAMDRRDERLSRRSVTTRDRRDHPPRSVIRFRSRSWHRPRHRHVLDLVRDGVGLAETDPSRQQRVAAPCPLRIAIGVLENDVQRPGALKGGSRRQCRPADIARGRWRGANASRSTSR